jgi:4-hydroxy-tetrahydrodipicolinate synthase
MFRPEGVFIPLMTPFREDGSVNEKVVRQIVSFLVGKGVDGLFPLSSVGEFIHLSFEEKIALMEIVMDEARGRVAVTPGATGTHPEEVIALARKAAEIGCQAVVIGPPYFYPINQDNLERHFEIIADAVQIPIILYNIPLFSPAISYDVVERLFRRNNFVGMKDSSGSMVDLMHYLDKIRSVAQRPAVMVGREEIFYPALMVGASGCLSATCGILPEIMVGIYRAWQEKKYEQAYELQLSILPLLRAMFSAPFPLGFKTAMELRGFRMGPPKQPLSASEKDRFSSTKGLIEKIMRFILDDRKLG